MPTYRSTDSRALAHRLPHLPIPNIEPSRSPYRVWSGSTTDEVRFMRISRKKSRTWYQKARAWDRQTKARRKHGGGIGLSAMRVLESFHFDFLNFTTGRLDPSYEGLARKTGLTRSTVAKAIAKLKELGIINWVRRCAHAYEDGIFTLRQKTNAYAVLPPSQWLGYVDADDVPAPWPEAWGATPPLPPLIEQAMQAAREGASLLRQAGLLDADPNDDTARSLASLARAMIERGGSSS